MKRPNGQGSIYFDKSKNRYAASFISPTGKRITKRFQTRTDAEAWLEDNRYNLRHNTFSSPTNIRTGQWMIQYLETYKSNIRPQSMASYILAIEKLQPIADIPLQKLTGMEIQHLINSLQGEISSSYIAKIMQLLNMAIKKAVALDILAKNPLATVERPKRTHKKIPIFTIDEVKALLVYTEKQPRLQMEIMIAAYTGMRIGEILALGWKDITPTFINVRKTLTRSANGMPIIEHTTKTSNSTRQISIPQSVYNKLISWKASTNDSEGLVFHSRTGSLLVASNERLAFKKAQTALGITPARGFHALRHTHASQLLANGVPIAEVSKRLGHASPAITLEVYTSWIPGNDEKIALDVDRIFK